MLGLIVGPEPVAAQKVFPYRVACDRAFNRRIEAAAKKAGMTPGQFVQAHFETIFDKADAGEGTAKPALGNVDPVAFAARHGISVLSARAWLWLAGKADGDGLVTVSLKTLAEASGSASVATGTRWRRDLEHAGLLEVVACSKGRDGSTYRVVAQP